MSQLEYGKIVLTLGNVLLPKEKLYPNPTPSMLDNLPWEIEYDLRLIGCELIQTACLLLKLPQTAVATGQVLFHRYFYSSSFVRRPMEIVAMACTTLAAKIEENARRIRDVVNVFHHIKQVRSGSLIQPLLIDQTYIDRKNAVINAERRLLKELGFCVYVKHSHKMITMYLRVLEKEREKDLVQTSWNYMNDSLRTDVFLRFQTETIACACIELASRYLQIALPRKTEWYRIFGAKPEEIQYIMIEILRLYKHRPKSLDELEKFVNAIRGKREDEKRKIRQDLHCDSPAEQQTVQTPVISTASPNNLPSQVLASAVTIEPKDTTIVTVNENGKGNNQNTSTNHTDHNRHRRKKRSSTRSRSSSRSSHTRSHKKKKTSHRSRSRSRSSSRKRHRHHKTKRHHSSHTSHNHRKKDKRYRSRSSSSEEKIGDYSNQNKSSISAKDANNNIHHRLHHSSKQTNGISSKTRI